ncbi:hypothetical protein StoSoilB3_43250 (plasmid) [Arthrobacter sp. StoSoilB3]|nr:hypothetical protein StoSoilB3_43250 [Arthrobacter sp. StoSoilB3]
MICDDANLPARIVDEPVDLGGLGVVYMLALTVTLNGHNDVRVYQYLKCAGFQF